MTQEPQSADPVDSALERLQAEVSQVTEAIRGLTAARERVPDYSLTLARLSQKIDETRQVVDQVAASPAARLSPETLTKAIIKSSSDARADDRQMIHEARDTLSRSLGYVDGMIKRGEAADRQDRLLIWSGIAGLLVGILLWSILPGAIARSLPASWQVPEWMAARTMGTDRASAAHRLVAAPHRGE